MIDLPVRFPRCAPMPVLAREHIRAMQGGSCPHLILTDDGNHYVVKFQSNPQHARILVNELVCYQLLRHLNLPVPSCRIVQVGSDFVENSPGLVQRHGQELRRCAPGLLFGSRYPVDPAKQAVYDYLPESLFERIMNRNAFLGMVPFDKWVSNAERGRRSISGAGATMWLSREAFEKDCSVRPRSLVFVANMIDNGFAFQAHRWTFADNPELGLLARPQHTAMSVGSAILSHGWGAFANSRLPYSTPPAGPSRRSGLRRSEAVTISMRCWNTSTRGAPLCQNWSAGPSLLHGSRFQTGANRGPPRIRDHESESRLFESLRGTVLD